MLATLVSTGIYIFIFLTGAAGLIYEVTWQKYLSRLLGSDSAATAIILAVFLGGLSLGYYLCGRLTMRVKRHFTAYAVLEGVIGVWCLCFPYIFKAIDYLTKSWSFSPPIMIICQGIFCSALLMGLPAVCMGGTVPVLTRGLSRTLLESTRVHATVYGINTAGAFAGALLAGFYLIPCHGLPVTMVNTSFLNLGAFLFFLLLPKLLKPTEFSEEPIKTLDQAGPRFPVLLLYAIAFLSGFYVMSLENVLIRITNLAVGSSSYSFSIIVSVFIFSIAAGSLVVSRLNHISRWLLYVNQILITILLLMIYISLDQWPYWAHLLRISFQSNTAGFCGYYILLFLGLTLILMLPAGLMGATVPIVFHELKRDLTKVGQHSGMILAYNTAGNLTGSLVGGIVLYYVLNNNGVFLTAVSLAAVSACLAGGHLSRKYILPTAALIVIIAVTGFFAPWYNHNNFVAGTFRIRTPLDYSFSGSKTFFEKLNQGFEVKYYNDGPAATVAVIQDKKIFPFFDKKSMALFVNGKSDSSTIGDIYTIKLLAHIPALLSEKRNNVMVVGLGTGVTAGELTLYPDIERIDVAEISPSVVAALPLFDQFTYGVHKDPRLNIQLGDAFRIIGRSKKKWDIIISEPSNPWVTGVDALFTKEFYRLVKAHLHENGVLMQWIHTIIASPRLIAMVLNTVQQEFKHSHVFLGGSDLLILASNQPVSCRSLAAAEATLKNNQKVQKSLKEINVSALSSLLVKECWTPSYLSDYFSDAEIQSLDYPKLHYLAGKDLFIGNNLPLTHFLSPETTAYIDEYLFYQQCQNWTISADTKEAFFALVESTRSRIDFENVSPITKALLFRSYLSDPRQYPLSKELLTELRDDLITFIARYPQDEKEWGLVGLSNTSYRQKAEPLLAHIENIRNWMVPFPLNGIITLLQKGIAQGQDAYEKNWCALQLAVLLKKERFDRNVINEILAKAIKGSDGKIILKEEDRHLLKSITPKRG